MSILVTYATAKGSTGEIAEKIASRLETYTPIVDCVPMTKVDAATLPSYSAIVVGSALHMASWLGPARSFIHSNAVTLKTKPVWAFSVGMPPTESDRAREEKMMDEKIRKDLPELRGHRLFQGRFYKKDLGWFLGAIWTCCVPKDKSKFGDERNWEVIEAWTDSIGKELRSAGSVSAV
jgi:menaquinone-dependent protoporphyrinogen oxidase